MKTTVRILTVALTVAFGATAFADETRFTERKENQQQRIAQGVESGQMTAREAMRAERGQMRIHQQARADRAANGGHLTPADRAQLNQMQNRQSARIYNMKHNARVGARAAR